MNAMTDVDPVDDMEATLCSAMAALDLRLDSATGAHVFNSATALSDLARSLLARRVLAPSMAAIADDALRLAAAAATPAPQENGWQELLAELANEIEVEGALYVWPENKELAAKRVAALRLAAARGEPGT